VLAARPVPVEGEAAPGWGGCPGVTVILSFRVSQVHDLRRPVVDSVADGTRAA
jgi:hypothetical protein